GNVQLRGNRLGAASSALKKGKAQGKKKVEAAQQPEGQDTEGGDQKGGVLPPLDELDRQAIAHMLVKGVPMPQIIAIYKENRRKAINKIAEDIEKGNIVLFNGKWMKAEDAMHMDTSKTGEAAKVAASSAVIGTVTRPPPPTPLGLSNA
ncbi:MAG: hypothetical protein ABSG92_11085, partial [Conexivisphaerales archaeon]